MARLVIIPESFALLRILRLVGKAQLKRPGAEKKHLSTSVPLPLPPVKQERKESHFPDVGFLFAAVSSTPPWQKTAEGRNRRGG